VRVTIEPDGSVTIRGAGWYWARFNAAGALVALAEGMTARPSHRQFLKDAHRALAAYVSQPRWPEMETAC